MSFFKNLFNKEEPFVPTPTQDVPGLDPLVVHAIENLFPDTENQKQAFDFSQKFLQTKKGNTVSLLAMLKMGILEIDNPLLSNGRFWMDAMHDISDMRSAKKWVQSLTKSQDQAE